MIVVKDSDGERTYKNVEDVLLDLFDSIDARVRWIIAPVRKKNLRSDEFKQLETTVKNLIAEFEVDVAERDFTRWAIRRDKEDRELLAQVGLTGDRIPEPRPVLCERCQSEVKRQSDKAATNGHGEESLIIVPSFWTREQKAGGRCKSLETERTETAPQSKNPETE